MEEADHVTPESGASAGSPGMQSQCPEVSKFHTPTISGNQVLGLVLGPTPAKTGVLYLSRESRDPRVGCQSLVGKEGS